MVFRFARIRRGEDLIDRELEARVVTRLEEMKQGQTIEQLSEDLHAPEDAIRSVLAVYFRNGYVIVTGEGLWKLVRRR